MPTAPLKPCLTHGCPTLVKRGARCQAHDTRPSRSQRGYDGDWYKTVKRAIAAQPWCSVCYATTDLTGDHIIPLSRGGTGSLSNCQVLCRRCNSRKGTG